MDLLARAQSGDEDAFRDLVAPYQRELHVHCYRMLGSVQDAEDALQDTLLSAWQSLSGFEGRSSIRTWLYRVATSRCLDALRAARRRSPADSMTGGPFPDVPAPTRHGEVSWLEPYPDVWIEELADASPGPDTAYESAESVSLAFIRVLQLLAPRQRAALILRDVLGYRASEAAQVLGTTEESVTSALKRARAALDADRPGRTAAGPPPPLPGSHQERRMIRQLTQAFQDADVSAIVALLSDDAWFTMPPLPLEYQGRELAAQFLSATAFRPGWTATLLETRANGQPAFGFYVRNDQSGEAHTVGLLAVTLSGDQIIAMTRFEATHLHRFGLPAELPPTQGPKRYPA
jgi:RNA polymerase sigma-70 factor (ECF subfamily)